MSTLIVSRCILKGAHLSWEYLGADTAKAYSENELFPIDEGPFGNRSLCRRSQQVASW